MKGFSFRTTLFLSLFGWLFPLTFLAQPTIISGSINTFVYAQSVDTADSKIMVANAAVASTFAYDDLVMIYQTQGAQVNESNSASFGNITNLRGAGTFELARVCAVNSNELLLLTKLTQTYYDTSVVKSRIQVIKVPQYMDAKVVGTLTAPAFDGQKGGIVALYVQDTLYLDGLIDVSEKGFRGGEQTLNTMGGSCVPFTSAPAYFYASAVAANLSGGKKGEGIAVSIPGKEHGKGALANGGGGGNGHNSGGGGGSNAAQGGQGGNRSTTIFNCSGNNPGLGGKTLGAFGYSATQQRAFFGGGGGAGDDNNNESGDGGNGGGMVIIWANVITGTGSIRSNGGSVAVIGSDGNAGGGAGGSILLHANLIDGATLTFEAKGGNGGSTKINCEGPGGGGSGGVIWSNVGLGSATTTLTAGTAGVAQACSNATQGATNGSGGSAITAGLAPPQGSTPGSCLLPVSIVLEGKSQEDGFAIFWNRLDERVNAFRVMRKEQTFWQQIALLDGEEYAFIDREPGHLTATYRLEAQLEDGRRILSNIIEKSALLAPTGFSMQVLYQPEPTLALSGLNPNLDIHMELMDLTGKIVKEGSLKQESTEATIHLPVEGLAAGMYVIRVKHQGRSQSSRFLIRTLR
ncbi:MAG: T9SS type A sorting domain-containing protein [Bacteroidia bacterium]|nr:T9SS type A sorting domain-containing protein [Bacteroidia bacterium]